MGSIADTLREKIEPLIKEEDLELVDLEYFAGGPASVLRIFVDQVGGITVDQCASLSRKIGDFLDMENLIPHRFTLEVSSPGLDRPLTTSADFKRKIGKKVKVFLKEDIGEKKELVGIVRNIEEENLILLIESSKSKASEEKEENVPLKKVAWAKIMLA